ncbi:MAG TPA: sulfite exporter TauE/SafE family protein [Methylocella sp.]|nr:sulfite exporter TauE/SafE family protein [Methylocella sp.]
MLLAREAAALASTASALTLGSGLIVGFILGLIGGGGSVLAVPLLVYVVRVPDPHIAIGTSAIAVAVSAFANLLVHARVGHVKWNCATVFAIAGVAGAIIGSSLGKATDGHKLLALFGAVMIIIAATMFMKKDVKGNPAVALTWATARHMTPVLIAYGMGVGALSGFFGIGGGFLVVPGLLAATGMPMISAVGSSLVSVTAFGLTTAINYAVSGLVDWPLAAIFIGGGIAGGAFGTRASKALAGRKQMLAKVFAIIVAAVGVYVIAKSLGFGEGA